MSRVLIVSNRLGVSAKRTEEGIRLERSVGGLATGMSSAVEDRQSLWVGWPGLAKESLGEQERREIAASLTEQAAFPVWLTHADLREFYYGFCNDVVWPLFHYFPTYVHYEVKHWEAYERVNRLFLSELLRVAGSEDIFWVHDYHLMLLPRLIRQELPASRIAFFLHIPFPSFEIFRLLPWRREIVEGLLGADLIGFHTYDYVRHFMSSARRLLGVEHSLGQIRLRDRVLRADAFPMGIDYGRYSHALADREVSREAETLRRRVSGKRVILSVDRLDYTKGIVQRLRGFDLFLESSPEFREKVTLILIVSPSRTKVAHYSHLKREVSELVGTINGRYGTIGWQPIQYMYRTFPFRSLTAVYGLADVLLVTPLRDGMNLIVKEYIATRQDHRGVAVLSETAGAASELGEALIVNPNDVEEIAAAIRDALEMPEEEQGERNVVMHERLRRYSVQQWAKDFLQGLEAMAEVQRAAAVRRFSPDIEERLVKEYRQAGRRLFLLDYDGTLVPFRDRPRQAGPDDQLHRLLAQLAGDPANEVVIVSGWDRHVLERWFSGYQLNLVAGQGAWLLRPGEEWHLTGQLNTEWKEIIRPILELHADRTPGTLVEEKEFALIWNYRRADLELAAVRVSELRDTLLDLSANLGLSIQDTHQLLEIRNAGANKAHGVGRWLESDEWGFILAAGDDWTDEAVFEVLPEHAFSVKVGMEMSRAKYFVNSEQALRELLARLCAAGD